VRTVLVSVPFVLAACTAQHDTSLGPTFGGDQRAAAAVERLASGGMPVTPLTEAGLLAAWPVAVGRVTCGEGLCLDARAAWLPDDELLVAVGVDVVAERAPATVAFALDASGSMQGYEDVRAASVEVALDHLESDDALGLWAFTGTAVELVPVAAVTDEQRDEVRRTLRVLDELPLLRRLVAEREGCRSSFDELFSELPTDAFDTADTADTAHTADTGLASLDTGWYPPPIAGAEAFREAVEASANPELGDRLVDLVCDDGSAIDEAAATVLASLPDGSVDRASRMVLVSDMGGPSARPVVVEAASRFVGTSVLGVTPDGDSRAAVELASAPGAHTLDAPTPAHALASWDARFDQLVYPLAWDVDLALSDDSTDDWVLERHVATTDDDQTGANALFASQGHGVLGVVLRPLNDDPAPPRLAMHLLTPIGEVTAAVASLVPYRLISTDWGEGDDEVALAVAWRLALVDAVKAGDEEAVQALLASRRPELTPTE